MKKLFNAVLLTSLCFFTLQVSAQYYYVPFIDAGQNPGGLNTDEDQTPATMIANYPGYIQVINSGSSTWSAQLNLPFSFDFNGNSYTKYYVSSNGVVTFSGSVGTVPSDVNAALPHASIPDNSICWWGINCTGANDGVIAKTFGTAPNRQYWITWASASWNGLSGTGWAYFSIVLEETSNRFYMVDARTYETGSGLPNLTAGVQFNSSSAISLPGSPNYQPVANNGGSDVGPDDNTYYMFAPGTQPTDDLMLSDVDAVSYTTLGGAPLDFSGTIVNIGSASLSSYDVSYTVNGGAAVSSSINGQNIASLASANFTHPTPWSPTAVGAYTIVIAVSNPNGNADPNPADNSATFVVNVIDTFIQRIPLYEVFTSSTCNPCNPGNANFHTQVASYPDEYVAVKYQQNFPGTGDPYCTDEAFDRRGYYGVTSIPRMEIDGGWDENAQNFTAQHHLDARNVPSFQSMALYYQLDTDSHKVSWCLDMHSFKAESNVTLQFAILETSTTANVKSNGETIFHQVMKKMVPDDLGRAVTLNASGGQRICDEYYFQGSYRLPSDGQDVNRIDHSLEHSVEDFDNLYVVAWIENDNLEVLQAVNGEQMATPPWTTGIVDEKEHTAFSIYPNPADDEVFVQFSGEVSGSVTIEVIDNLGHLVSSVPYQQGENATDQILINTSKLTAGLYFINLVMEDEMVSKKLMINK